jgi:hypothetical protein
MDMKVWKYKSKNQKRLRNEKIKKWRELKDKYLGRKMNK